MPTISFNQLKGPPAFRVAPHCSNRSPRRYSFSGQSVDNVTAETRFTGYQYCPGRWLLKSDQFTAKLEVRCDFIFFELKLKGLKTSAGMATGWGARW
jgi:hypothetical protein